MAKVKIPELQGAALDWAVAEALGRHAELQSHPVSGKTLVLADRVVFHPTTNWSQGGPLIDKHIGLIDVNPGTAYVETKHFIEGGWANGDTVLQAVCRAIVAAHTEGDTVDIPDELVDGSE